MKRHFIYIVACIVALCMASCGNNTKEVQQEGAKKETVKKEQTKQAAPKKKKNKKSILKPNASGLPYEMLVVMDDAQWERPLGRAVFNVLDSDVPGLPQSDILFL